MVNNKFFIISIGIVLTIILIICGILLTISNNDNVENNVNTNDLPQTIEVTRVKNRNDFFTVTNCVDRYITYLCKVNNFESLELGYETNSHKRIIELVWVSLTDEMSWTEYITTSKFYP